MCAVLKSPPAPVVVRGAAFPLLNCLSARVQHPHPCPRSPSLRNFNTHRGLSYAPPHPPLPPETSGFLSLAEAFGCKLLTSNTTKLQSVLAEFARIMSRDVYPRMAHSSRTSPFVAAGQKFDAHLAGELASLLPLMKDEETLAASWDKVQASLEDLLPKVRAHVTSLLEVQLPALEASLKPEQQEALVEAIRASQALFKQEEEDRIAAEAAALLKTRAGKKMAALAAEQRRAEAKRLAEAGGKKSKGQIEEENLEAEEKKKALEAKRAARAASAAKRKSAASAASTPATVFAEGHDVSELTL